MTERNGCLSRICLNLSLILLASWCSAATYAQSPSLRVAEPAIGTDTVPVAQIRVYFTPGNTVETAIAETIAAAQHRILVQAYSFTNPMIVQALADARARGVEVIVVLDKSNRNQKYSAADFTSHSGIETLIDDRHAIAHNKIMIIDEHIVITGSYNFTRAAEKSNAENLVIIVSAPIAQKYLQNWQKHRKHSQHYQPKAGQ